MYKVMIIGLDECGEKYTSYLLFEKLDYRKIKKAVKRLYINVQEIRVIFCQ